MNVKCNSGKWGERGAHLPRAFTLVEMIGVLAVVALAAAVFVPASLRHLDQVASDQEMARMQALGDALRKGILRTRTIPSYTNWATFVAAEAGLDITAVTNNVRNHPRILLVDSGGWLSTNIPYIQSYQGTPVLPANARVMLLSSLGQALPISSGMPNALDFQELWDAPAGTVPWTFWTGDPDDVMIHRVNLSPLFVKLVLSSYTSASNGVYAVLRTNALNWSQKTQVPFGAGYGAYFLKGTGLRLYRGDATNTLDATQILNDDASFVYEAGEWKSSVQGRVTFGVGDIAGIVAAFLSSTPNIKAQDTNGNMQQIRVVQTFTDYMSNYNVWADGGFTNSTLKTYLKDVVQPDMMDAVRGLYYKGSTYDNYPTNDAPCP